MGRVLTSGCTLSALAITFCAVEAGAVCNTVSSLHGSMLILLAICRSIKLYALALGVAQSTEQYLC